MDDDQRTFISTFKRFIDEVLPTVEQQAKLTPLGHEVQEHLGVDDITTLPTLVEQIRDHRLVDADLALAELGRQDSSRVIGVSHGQQKRQEEFSSLLQNPYAKFSPGPVEYRSVTTGPDSSRRVVEFGVHLIHFDGHPVAVLQCGANPQFGQMLARLEVLAEDPAVADAVMTRIRSLMVSLSVLRGQVISFSGDEYGQTAAGVTFLRRPEVGVDDVILPDGVMVDVSHHVIGIGEHRERLRSTGQHLKRGVLLYGPPGTGKTLTVRHLIGRAANTTVVVLNGPTIRFITAAAELARAMQPAMVVLEDVDLIAGDRELTFGSQPLLFEVLDALDGLEGDSDIAFVLTTNRVEHLERALADRPGRVDLAVEIPLPDIDARRRLFALYARDLPFSADAVQDAADRSEGVTGSFAKELIRRAVLTAAAEDRPTTDQDLNDALDGLTSARQVLTRKLLTGGGPDASDSPTTGWMDSNSHG